MDRRKTLGGLSPGQLNVRASFCPARVNKEAEKSNAWGTKIPVEKALSRLSIAGTVRRSSAHTVKGAGPWNDPRPIKDPAFQHKCAQAIIEYLATHKYEHQVAPKMLSSISTKDFTNIMTFLLRQLDPTLARSPTLKLEEEVPALFSRLHYPIKISRSSLTAVGSPHTWPGIL
ncbi:HEC/Ndc80p family protein, partial [Helicosporidium sp. ATCC 50920]